MIDRLPTEILLRILDKLDEGWLIFNRKLCYVSRRFYLLFNGIRKEEFLKLLPYWKTRQLLPFIHDYIKSLEFWNGPLQKLVAPEPLWWIAQCFIHNRKVFFQREFCQIQETGDEQCEFSINDFQTLKVNGAATFNYKQDLYLPNGGHTLKIVFKYQENTRGLRSMGVDLTSLDQTKWSDDTEEELDEDEIEIEGRIFNLPTDVTDPITPGVLVVERLMNLHLNDQEDLGRLGKHPIVMKELGTLPNYELEYLDFRFDWYDWGFDRYKVAYYTIPKGETILSDLERSVHVALELLLQDKDPQLARSLFRRPGDLESADWEKFYTEGTTPTVKTGKTPNEDYPLEEKMMRQPIKQWKVPF